MRLNARPRLSYLHITQMIKQELKQVLFTITLLFCTVLIGCKNEKKTTTTKKKIEKITPTQETEKSIEENRQFKKIHQTPNYTLTITSTNEETSTINVFTEGEIYNFKETLEIEGKVLDSYMTDINKDGFKEFFLKIKPTDDSGNLALIGFASNKGKSISEIYIVDIEVLIEMNSDNITVHKNGIQREFKVDGKIAKYTYELLEGETGYVLEPKKL